MLWQTALVASLMASGAQAGIGSLIMDGISRGSPAVERRLQEIAKSHLRARKILDTRQTPGSTGLGSDVVLNENGSINMTAWDAQANAACDAALKALSLASNPSGTCVCYNLPALNNATGAFEADLRLYQLNEPTGAFQGIPPENIKVVATFKGSTANVVSSSTAQSKVVAARQATTPGNSSQLRLLQTYLFLGQIDQNEMANPMDMGRLQSLVMPVITLKANNSQGRPIDTKVSSNEAAFVTGVFSQAVVMSSFRLAELAVQDEVARLKNGTTAFVLPGVQILIFPIGLVVTSLWMVLGIGAYAYGTYYRYQFRDSFMKRQQRLVKSSVPRI
ncbi:hypothetical protein B0H63DRAFT_389598 [Podospora didyma]|uniref:Uncharacterized protein n=1 Tax=Podospora didyma TaxID=330526 RepID=A0AAE0U473_9PEZI|nr:hypothetical protein B0H63DRAFT_389598 [Podospora didyma]